jgi:hypothetical protein
VPTYVGIDASVNVMNIKVSAFDLRAGASAGSGVGFKDYSVGGKVMGTGITIGKRVSISVPGLESEINFGCFF